MPQTKLRFSNFDDYLNHAPEQDALCELFNGELIEVPPESGENTQIAVFLVVQFSALLGFRRVRPHGLELEVRGEPRNRFPDLTILAPNQEGDLRSRNTLRLFMLPPVLVVEVVSPGELQQQRDYVAKRSQYQDRGIPEYWLVDPSQQQVLVLALVDGVYQEFGTFRGDEGVRSPQFQTLPFTAQQLLQAGLPD